MRPNRRSGLDLRVGGVIPVESPALDRLDELLDLFHRVALDGDAIDCDRRFLSGAGTSNQPLADHREGVTGYQHDRRGNSLTVEGADVGRVSHGRTGIQPTKKSV